MANYRVTYGSVEELHTVAERHFVNDTAYRGRGIRPSFTGVESLSELKTLAIDGWAEEAAHAMSIAESAIETVAQDVSMPSFTADWAVAGSEVDVARYLSGEPECMIEYEPVATPRYGRVIVLCSSISVSGSVSTETIKRRGHAVAALAFALANMGFSTELWVDMTSKARNGDLDSTRVLVKGANDEIDAARIMFAFAHPGMMRALAMPAMHEWPEDKQKAHGVGNNYGKVTDPIKDLPEGTIYLPSVCSDRDVPDADKELARYLSELGIV